MDTVLRVISDLFGLNTDSPEFGQILLRAVFVYCAMLALLKISERRFLGKHTAFDFILAIMLGSILSRPINGTAPLVATIGAGLVLVGLHYLFAALAFHTDSFGTYVKGNPELLVKDGKIIWQAMKKRHITQKDLEEAMRLKAAVTDVADVQEAYFERNGEISVIPKRRANS